LKKDTQFLMFQNPQTEFKQPGQLMHPTTRTRPTKAFTPRLIEQIALAAPDTSLD
jgi:UDP-3-O-[3-hydroxymyristoyl] glucosamine N-acyltransferase